MAAGDWPLGGRFVRLSEETSTQALHIGIWLTGDMRLRSLPQCGGGIKAFHCLPGSSRLGDDERHPMWTKRSPHRASFPALLFTPRSPESSFLYTGFTSSKRSAGNVSLEGHEDMGRFTRLIVSIVLGLEYIPFKVFMEDRARDQQSTSGGN